MNILVTVDDAHRDELEQIARKLKSAGMDVADIFSLGGVIAGEAAPADLPKIRSLAGVETVEEEPSFHAS